MLITKVIDSDALSELVRRAFSEMATWRYAKYFLPEAKHPYALIGLYQDDWPVGLFVINFSFDSQFCEIIHRHIVPYIDQEEATKKLVAHVIEAAQDKHLPLITINYPLTAENAIFDKQLNDTGWKDGYPWMTEYCIEVKYFLPKWLQQKIPIPTDFSILNCDELTPAHQRTLDQTIHGNGVPHYLTPYYVEEYKQKCNTLFLLDRKRVIGWSCTHTYPDSIDTVRYSSLYLHPKYRYHGYSIRLLAESIRLHKLSGIRYGLFTLALAESSKNWKGFIEKRLKPYAQTITTIIRRDRLL